MKVEALQCTKGDKYSVATNGPFVNGFGIASSHISANRH